MRILAKPKGVASPKPKDEISQAFRALLRLAAKRFIKRLEAHKVGKG